MIRLTGRGSPAEDTKTSRPAMPVNGVCPPGLSRSKPLTPRAERRVDRRSVVTIAHALLTLAHEAMGWLKARRSARPCALQGKECEVGLRARPRLSNNRAGGALVFRLPRKRRRESPATSDSSLPHRLAIRFHIVDDRWIAKPLLDLPIPFVYLPELLQQHCLSMMDAVHYVASIYEITVHHDRH